MFVSHLQGGWDAGADCGNQQTSALTCLSLFRHREKSYFQPQTTAEVMRRWFCGGFRELLTRVQLAMRLNIVDCGQREANN